MPTTKHDVGLGGEMAHAKAVHPVSHMVKAARDTLQLSPDSTCMHASCVRCSHACLLAQHRRLLSMLGKKGPTHTHTHTQREGRGRREEGGGVTWSTSRTLSAAAAATRSAIVPATHSPPAASASGHIWPFLCSRETSEQGS